MSVISGMVWGAIGSIIWWYYNDIRKSSIVSLLGSMVCGCLWPIYLLFKLTED